MARETLLKSAISMAIGRLALLLKSGLATSAGLSVFGTGGYVLFKDKSRFPRIEDTFASGNILSPLADNQAEIIYFKRPDLETSIKKMLSSSFSNEYYLISGEVGCGKTRVVLEMVRQRIAEEGSQGQGAPVYVLATQGKTFAESLASATNFFFDEHIRFRFFLDSILKIQSMPHHDEHNKLMRVLNAIEEAGYRYMKKSGRPAVIVIDSADYIAKHLPEGMARMQEKAKLWADANIVKLVFITNAECVERSFRDNQSAWSRADSTFTVGDLSCEEAIDFLKRPQYHHGGVGRNKPSVPRHSMTQGEAETIVAQVGGRIQHLLQFRRDWEEGIPYHHTAERLKAKELEKLTPVLKRSGAIKALRDLLNARTTTLCVGKRGTGVSEEDIIFLAKRHILGTHRTDKGIDVRFQSVLTEHVVRETLHRLGE